MAGFSSVPRPRAAVLLDFDGTLSEIAPSPEAARPAPGAADALSALARSYRRVAVVSGRRAAEVADLLGRPPGVTILGLYGREDADRRAVREEDRAAAPERILAAAEAVAGSVEGARVETKGPNIAVHYRAAADPDRARMTLEARLRAIASSGGYRLLEGKRVIELAPADDPGKGAVVRRVAREDDPAAILYAGDDVADLDAFAAVREMEKGGVAGVTVAVRGAETPDDLVTSADVTVDGPPALVELLNRLAG